MHPDTVAAIISGVLSLTFTAIGLIGEGIIYSYAGLAFALGYAAMLLRSPDLHDTPAEEK